MDALEELELEIARLATPEERNKLAIVRERKRVWAKLWRDANPERSRASRDNSYLRSRYGITREQYEHMLRAQGGRCKICRKSVEEASLGKGAKNYRLGVDHDHKTGVVRGLLCDSCNKILGYADDSADLLYACIKYLVEASV